LFDWSATTAFALTSSSNAIFIRKAATPGAPGVPPEDYAAFRERLVKSLEAFSDPKTGRAIIKRVLRREDAFPGNQMDSAPDLLLELQDHSFLSILRTDAPLKPRPMPYGTHHPNGIFIAAGPGIRAGVEIEPFSILDVAPTLLYSLGLPIPGDLEGTVVRDAFEPSYLEAHPVQIGVPTYSSAALPPEQAPEKMDADAEAQVRIRLKALGYLA
jgi:predicted AlkP superfamily phosphohydrolase/phosphomutase